MTQLKQIVAKDDKNMEFIEDVANVDQVILRSCGLVGHVQVIDDQSIRLQF